MAGHVLIVGASRGVGLGLVDRHLGDGWSVHVTTRDGSRPRPGVTAHRLDVTDASQLTAMISSIDRPFDRVIHSAGIMNQSEAEMIRVNADAPIAVVQALLDAGLVVQDGVVAIMTSQLGARRGKTGSLGGYGDSKAALNDEFRRRAAAWRDAGSLAVVIHPGWVRTEMGGAGALISVEESVDGITDLLDGVAEPMHGRFWTWDGREHPW